MILFFMNTLELMKQKILLFPLFLIIAGLAIAQGAQPVCTFSFPDLPDRLDPGQAFQLKVDFSTNLHELGLAARLYIEMRRAPDGDIITTSSADNNRRGFEGPSGSQTFSLNAPPWEGFVYFRAFLAPLEFNPWILAETLTYPRDGTYPYKWTGNGVTHDIIYRGATILTNNSGNYTYCSGITYEAFMDAWETYNAAIGNTTADIWGLTSSQMVTFRQRWYGIMHRDCSTDALTTYNCGYRINDWDKARAGDMVQIWRKSGSGHSVVFDSWIRNGEGEKTHIRYWSTQTATNGINYNEENFTALTDETSFCRVVKPPDSGDNACRYADADTSATLTRIGAAIPTPSPPSGFMLYTE